MQQFERFVAFTLLHDEIGKSLQKIKTEYMCRFGLRSSDALFLAILCSHPEGLTAAALAKACGVDRAVISRALPDLLASGAVSYAEGQASSRGYRARLLLTERGKQVITEMTELSALVVGEASKEVPAEDLATFYRVLRTIDRNLTAHAHKLETSAAEEGDPK